VLNKESSSTTFLLTWENKKDKYERETFYNSNNNTFDYFNDKCYLRN